MLSHYTKGHKHAELRRNKHTHTHTHTHKTPTGSRKPHLEPPTQLRERNCACIHMSCGSELAVWKSNLFKLNFILGGYGCV